MKLISGFLFTLLSLHVCVVELTTSCEHVHGLSGIISFSTRSEHLTQCWYIETPDDSYVNLKSLSFDFYHPDCKERYLEISGDVVERICETYWQKTSMRSVNITLKLSKSWSGTSFNLLYNIENYVCAQKSHFRCSENQCIQNHQVCDGINDCNNGKDESHCGVNETQAIYDSRKNAIDWLKARRISFGWGKNTHRAITALFLTESAKFRGTKFDEEAMVKQLQLQTMKALLRNSTTPMSVNDLSMYINALAVTCHNYRNFYGFDLLKILAERAYSASSPSPGAYLTLCNANWVFSGRHVHQMLDLLTRNVMFPFLDEFKAMTVMALTCMKERATGIWKSYADTYLYYETIQSFAENQHPDGSFGNEHTTALVAQALLSSREINSTEWHSYSAVKYLMQSLNSSSVDFLEIYLSLPFFNHKSLVDIGRMNCSNYQRDLGEDDEIYDIKNKYGKKIEVQYSLYIGDKKDVVYTILLKVSQNSSIYDVMKVAEIDNPKYKFSYQKKNDHTYVYKIGEITNDMEAQNFWLLYKEFPKVNGTTYQHFTASPDKIKVENKEHLIMWYKTVHI